MRRFTTHSHTSNLQDRSRLNAYTANQTTSRRVRTPAALPEMPSLAEIEFIESVERFSHTDWVHEQRTEPVCDAAIRYLLLGRPSVVPDDFLLRLAPHKCPPLLEARSLAEKGRLYTDDDGILLLVPKLTPPTPVCPDKPGGRACGPPLTRRTYANLRSAAHASVDYASVPR